MLLNQIRGKEVVFKDHSISSAIAALAALHYRCISSSGSASAPVPPVLCVTFGSPLLGNEALCGSLFLLGAECDRGCGGGPIWSRSPSSFANQCRILKFLFQKGKLSD
ncbi:hypothetical protein ACQ4PT_018847 [Festuca glaucescens]